MSMPVISLHQPKRPHNNQTSAATKRLTNRQARPLACYALLPRTDTFWNCEERQQAAVQDYERSIGA
jgi:hypothetical protein